MTMLDFALTERFRLRTVRLAGVVLAAAAAPGYAQQQQGIAPWLDVVIVEVRGGAAADFEDRVKELMAARAEANMPPTLPFQVVSGHPNVYHFISPKQAMADNDTPPEPPMSPEEMAIWESRISQTTDSIRFFVARTYPQYSLGAEQGPPESEMLFLRTVKVAPGRQADYEAWVGQQLMPALRETDLQSHTMSNGFVGDSPQNFYHAITLENWAALDSNPLLEVLGEEGYRRLSQGLVGIAQSDEITVLRPRTDLLPQAGTPAQARVQN